MYYPFNKMSILFYKTYLAQVVMPFVAYCQNERHAAGTRARKIVSIRQFWKYLKTKAFKGTE